MEINIFGLRIFLNVPYRSIVLLLILNALVVITYFLMAKLRENRIIKFGNFETLKRVEGYQRFSTSPLLLITKMFIVTMLFLVATNSIKLNIMKPVSNTDFVIALDTSASMLTPDYSPNRLEAAKTVALKWLYNLPESTRIGIVAFSDNATKVLEPTTQYGKIKRSIKNLRAAESGGTAIGHALITAASMLKYSDKQKAIVLITDGKSNNDSNINMTIQALQHANIVVYSIGIGNNNKTIAFFNKMQSILNASNITKGKNYTYFLPEINESMLEIIANSTNGKSFIIENQSSLEEAFNKIFLTNERISLDSDYYILLFLTFLIILELIIYARYGAI